MRRFSALAAALLVAAIGTLACTHRSAAQSNDGWIVLFDGKNLDHFSPIGDANWRIEDGVLVADKASKISYLVSKDDYTDYQIRAEFWVSDDANSGVFIRCDDPKKIGAKECYECNIFDKRPDPSYGTGAIVYVAEVNPMPKAGGKWSTMEITAKGRDLSIVFDGKPTASARVGLHDKGHIALQFGVGTVKFRKVEIKPL